MNLAFSKCILTNSLLISVRRGRQPHWMGIFLISSIGLCTT
nr:MAG TPA: hypothetical protein [Caudoviricetes sp.]